jgi:glycosyltransferase involved in cell wall biosynthesis
VRVLLAVTYYRPHVSGLTIYSERLAHGLVARGHAVTVLTSRHLPDTPRQERLDGVDVVRVPVAARVGKGPLMPTFAIEAARQARTHDILNLHLPQLDAPGLVLAGRATRRPSVVTYHCDLRLPPGAVNRVAEQTNRTAERITVALADRTVAYTRDYAEHTSLLRRHAAKIEIIPPPVVIAPPAAADVAAFRAANIPGDGPAIGFAARFAAEKGVDTLLAALPAVRQRFPQLRVLFAGPHEHVPGEAAYRERLRPAIAQLGDRWRFLGVLDAVTEMPAFFGAIDVLVVPSLNSTESFGLVQVEAMLCGTPVVASDLPGVRQPLRSTGMGEIVPTGDPGALAAALVRVLSEPDRYTRPRHELEQLFDPQQTFTAYEALFQRLVGRGGSSAIRAGG